MPVALTRLTTSSLLVSPRTEEVASKFAEPANMKSDEKHFGIEDINFPGEFLLRKGEEQRPLRASEGAASGGVRVLTS